MRIPALFTALWLTATFAPTTMAQDNAEPENPLGAAAEAMRGPPDAGDLPETYKWEDAAREVLTENQIKQLAADKLIIPAKSTYSQAGEAYYWSSIPPFVTSDSLLAGYHRIYGESIMLMEHKRASQLRPVLQTLWAYLPDGLVFFGDPEERTEAARHRAQFVIGVAMRLLSDEPLKPAADGKLARQIEAEVARVMRAGAGGAEAGPNDGEAPDWLPPLDYDRLKPRGFYTRTEPLKRYFRAVAWLQEVPFFIDDDASLAAVIMLVRAISEGWGEEEPAAAARPGEPPAPPGKGFRTFSTEFEQFVGGRDDWDLTTFAGFSFGGDDPDKTEGLLDAFGLEEARTRLLRWWERGVPYRAGLVGDVQAFDRNEDPEAAGDAPVVRPYFHVLSALRTPDAVMFTETAGSAFPQRAFPNGLEVPAALGSAEALALLRAKDGDELADLVRDGLIVEEIQIAHDDEEAEEGKDGNHRTLYADYLHCLQPLLDGPEPDAPPLFASTPWKRKSLQTVCAGWAQLRHTWTLQAKEAGGLFGGNRPIAGFVEPEPEFFARLAELAERTERTFERRGVFDLWRLEMAANARAAADLIDRKDFAGRGAAALAGLTPTEREQLDHVIDYARDYTADGKPRPDRPGEIFGGEPEGEPDDAQVALTVAALAAQLRADARDVEEHRPIDSELARRLTPDDSDLRDRWRLLAQLARRLESLAHKQLRGVTFSNADDNFLRGYGMRLCNVMGYHDAYGMEDDAPWVASVFHRQLVGNLQVATGRPTAMYLLYPYGGREVLCLGVVVPYHEFVRSERLTDEAWRALLDSPERPPVPEWVRRLYSDEELPKDDAAADTDREDRDD